MESLLQNPAFDQISEKILACLHHNDLLSFRATNSSAKMILQTPRFWLKLCIQKASLSENLQKGWTELIQSVEEKDFSLQENVTKALMKLHHRTIIKQLPLFVVSAIGDLSLTKFIIENVDSEVTRNSSEKTDVGGTPIHNAAYGGHLDVMKLLIAKTHNPNPVDKRGISPLTWAIIKGHIEIVKYLVTHVENSIIPGQINQPLHAAAMYGNLEMFKVLENLSGIPNNIQGHFGYTPLHHAVIRDRLEIVKYLLNANENPIIPNNQGDTPIHHAARDGKIDALKILIPYVDNINIMNSFAQTPKMIAKSCGHQLIVDYLTEYEAKITKSTKDAQTPRKRMKQFEQ